MIIDTRTTKSAVYLIDEEYMVNGLGFLTSQRIVYETITTQLVENSNFAQFRSSTLAVVEDLYGDTSNVYKQVINAWHAVGVGHPYMDSNIEGDFGICDGGVYSVDVHPAVSVTWSVDKFNDIFSQKDKLTFVSGQGTNTIVVNRANRSGMSVDGNFVKYSIFSRSIASIIPATLPVASIGIAILGPKPLTLISFKNISFS